MKSVTGLFAGQLHLMSMEWGKTMKTKMCAVVSGVCALLMGGLFAAESEPSVVQMYLPLFERNSLGRKILDVRYSLKYEFHTSGKNFYGKRDVHLVFDGTTGKCREEMKDYDSPNDTNVYDYRVHVWNGNKAVEWRRSVSQNPGNRALGAGVYESSGSAVIQSRPGTTIPAFMRFCYTNDGRPFASVVPEQNPQLASHDGDVIIIETQSIKFVFLKKTGALTNIIYYTKKPNNNEMFVERTCDLSGHVECSGFLIPLQFVQITRNPNGEISTRMDYSVDPQSVRLLDAVDVSIFGEVLPAGCNVNDEIGKKVYTVSTVDTLPNGVDAVKQTLEKMLKQAEEQKNAVQKK